MSEGSCGGLWQQEPGIEEHGKWHPAYSNVCDRGDSCGGSGQQEPGMEEQGKCRPACRNVCDRGGSYGSSGQQEPGIEEHGRARGTRRPSSGLTSWSEVSGSSDTSCRRYPSASGAPPQKLKGARSKSSSSPRARCCRCCPLPPPWLPRCSATKLHIRYWDTKRKGRSRTCRRGGG